MLPELLEIKEFVNADEIARGISPFQPGKAALEAGRIMLHRLQELLARKEDFAFETTLATRSFAGIIRNAKAQGYTVNLLYWLDNVDLAIRRVRIRVSEGGHDIPQETIVRRYYAGLKNFLTLYQSIVDYWLLMDNSYTAPVLIAESQGVETNILDQEKWNFIHKLATDENRRNPR